MTTFKQFLCMEQCQTAADLIRRDCKPFLQEAKGKGFLYRGVNLRGVESLELPDGSTYYVKNVRKDRLPLSTPGRLSRIIDNWFQRKFGFKARSNSMFSVGEMGRGDGSYGEPCIVFPIGQIQYAWSDTVSDLFVKCPSEFTYDDVSEQAVEEWLSDMNYTDADLPRALRLSVEIMVKCDRYYAFPMEYRQELKKALGNE